MTKPTDEPLSRPLKVDDVPPEGLAVTVEANSEEREALAAALKLPAVHSLVGNLDVRGSPARLAVTGRVEASIRQNCVVTLEPFDSKIAEEVAVTFAEGRNGPSAGSGASDISRPGREPPDEIVDGVIDLGALTAEFLALGLDPYPKRPGAAFAHENDTSGTSPFAGLAELKAKLPRGA